MLLFCIVADKKVGDSNNQRLLSANWSTASFNEISGVKLKVTFTLLKPLLLMCEARADALVHDPLAFGKTANLQTFFYKCNIQAIFSVEYAANISFRQMLQTEQITQEILRFFYSRLTTDLVEGMNSRIQEIEFT